MTEQELQTLLSGVQKPGRYTGGELGSVVKSRDTAVRVALCFPDTYEIGMSHLGLKILYALLNNQPDVWCERAFMPQSDMEENLKKAGRGIFCLESFDCLKNFDIIGFTLQYELCYTTMLRMLKISGIPLLSSERQGLNNLVIVGGSCTCNAEPIADFVDAVFLGEAEESLVKFTDLYKEHKRKGASKAEFLSAAAEIKGVYIPCFYDVKYNEDGTVSEIIPKAGAPKKAEKAIVKELDKAFYPESFVVPYIDVVHDRAVAEVFRGCIRGCRFCQAGMITRPYREKSAATVSAQARRICDSTGYDEVSLCSLSTSDYTQLGTLLDDMLNWTEKEKINISLPSMRIDAFSKELHEKISKVRKSTLTFAPEAGSQRMRDVINKNLDEEAILSACETAFLGGQTNVKLYFMIGLPTETDDDILAIGTLAQKIVDLYYSLPTRPKGRGVGVSVSLATLTPKPHTPFQWVAQDKLSEIQRKQELLVKSRTTKKISVSRHSSNTSLLEAAFARGDRRLCRVLQSAVELGCYLDSWDDFLDFSKWEKAFADNGLTMDFYANRERNSDELLPWSHLDFGVSKEFLAREYANAKMGVTTKNCREGCSGCGVLGGTDCGS